MREGRSTISDIPSDRLAPLTINHYPFTINHSPPSRLTATIDYSVLAGCDAAIICVPTPLNKTRDPDVRYHDPYVAEFAHNGHGPAQRGGAGAGAADGGRRGHRHRSQRL